LQTKEELHASIGASAALLEAASIKQGQYTEISLRIAVRGKDGRYHAFYTASVPLNMVGVAE
jgi:hypothetical protein